MLIKTGALLRNAVMATQTSIVDAVNVDTVRLAVTGLSGAGKTVFLVSLINNFLAMGKGLATLPALGKKLSDNIGNTRLLNVQIAAPNVGTITPFDYQRHLITLAGGAWPSSTDDLSEITLTLTLKRKEAFGGLAGKLLGNREVRLELLDYPGEWLLDLPLLDQTFDEWSKDTLKLLQQPSRAVLAADFLSFLSKITPKAPANAAVAALGHDLYRKLLKECHQRGLRWLQPGRFLIPGLWPAKAPFMEFFPLLGEQTPTQGTLGALLRDRFEAYKRQVRDQFFELHFRRFNRQVILVDVLDSLFAGQEAFEEAERALTNIAKTYARLLENKWLPGPRIERVAFAATKADHVPSVQQPALQLTLESMVTATAANLRRKYACTFHTIASVLCTHDDVDTDANGIRTPVVVGVPVGDTKARPFSPGIIPAGAIPPGFFAAEIFRLPVFSPPAILGGAAGNVPHAGLDTLLTDLIGDLL